MKTALAVLVGAIAGAYLAHKLEPAMKETERWLKERLAK